MTTLKLLNTLKSDGWVHKVTASPVKKHYLVDGSSEKKFYTQASAGTGLRFYLMALVEAKRILGLQPCAPCIAHYGPAKYYEALLLCEPNKLPQCIPGKKAGTAAHNRFDSGVFP